MALGLLGIFRVFGWCWGFGGVWGFRILGLSGASRVLGLLGPLDY